MAKKHFNGSIQEQVFKEYPIVDRLHVKPNEYDITGKHVNTFDFRDSGRFSFKDYSMAILITLTKLSETRIPEFLTYQLENISDRKTWLQDLETLIENNILAIETYKPGAVNFIKTAIKQAMIATGAKPAPQIKWNGKDIELLELITSLVESGAIVDIKGQRNTSAAIRAFEEMLGIQVKDSWKKMEKFKSRKRSKTPFLNKLIGSFEKYASKR